VIRLGQLFALDLFGFAWRAVRRPRSRGSLVEPMAPARCLRPVPI
jgi:hypothetical protein